MTGRLITLTTPFYDRLFEKFPDVQDLFVPFRGLNSEELRQNVGLREHGMRVMGTIEKCITRIEQPDKLTSMLESLGEKHVVFDTKIEYFDVSLFMNVNLLTSSKFLFKHNDLVF